MESVERNNCNLGWPYIYSSPIIKLVKLQLNMIKYILINLKLL